jgi:Transposase IS200 like
MSYATGCHTVFHHRYHIVWVTKYRYKVLEGTLRERIRTIIRQVSTKISMTVYSSRLRHHEGSGGLCSASLSVWPSGLLTSSLPSPPSFSFGQFCY